MAITYVGASTLADVPSGNVTPTWPAAYTTRVATDVAVIVGHTCSSTANNTPFTTPSGWSPISIIDDVVGWDGGTGGIQLFRRVLTGGDTLPTLVTTTNGSNSAFVVVGSGVDNTTPEDATPVVSSATSAAWQPTGITTVTDGALVFSCFFNPRWSHSPTASGHNINGFTLIYSEGTRAASAAARILRVTAGAQTMPTWASDSDGVCHIAFAWRPAGAGGGTTDVNPSPTVITVAAAVGNIGGQADVAAASTVVTVVAATASVAGTASIAPAATIVTTVTAVGNVTGNATITPTATTVTTVAGTGNVGATANVAPSPTVVTVVSAVGNVSGTQAVEPAPTVVTVVTAVANIAATANITPAATVVNVFAATGNVEQTVLVEPAATIITTVTAVANVAGHATVAGSSTTVTVVAATAQLTAQADVNPAATIVVVVVGAVGVQPPPSSLARRWRIRADDRSLAPIHDRTIRLPANTTRTSTQDADRTVNMPADTHRTIGATP